MKKFFLPMFVTVTTILFSAGCRKTAPTNPDDGLIQEARFYFQQNWQGAPATTPDSNLRNTGPRAPDWSKARVVLLAKATAVVVPIHYTKPFYLGSNFGGIRQYPADDLAQLLVYRDSFNLFHAEMMTSLPDSNYKDDAAAPFTGMILVDQWNGMPLSRYRIDGHGARVWRPGQAGGASQRLVVPNGLIIETCYEVGGYNYAPSLPNEGVAWIESAGCSYSFIAEVPTTQLLDAASYMQAAGGGAVGVHFHPNPIYPGDGGIVDGGNLSFQFDSLPGIDLAKYFKCFTYIPDQGAVYSVTLCADIPVDSNPGALLTTGLKVGHTFIILTKSNGRLSFSQSFGFYPQNSLLSSVIPFVSSKMGDDGAADHQYDASLNMPNISQLDFQTLENLAVDLANSQKYSLYNYNCTDYALQVFNSIRVNDPVKVSDWIGPYTGINVGTTPNGLYETLVGMQTFFAGATNPNVRIGSMHAPASSGPCN